MTNGIALHISYPAIILAAIEELAIDKPLKNVVIRLSDLSQSEVYVA